MSKAHRGKGIRDQAACGRGTCPVCNRSNIKVLYEQEAGEAKLKICKTCRAALKHGKKDISHLAVAKPAVEAAPAGEAVSGAGA